MNIEFAFYYYYFTLCEMWRRSSWLDVIAYVAIAYAVYRVVHFAKHGRAGYGDINISCSTSARATARKVIEEVRRENRGR